ncbi:osteopetrosis-associated transmembrane protein 1 [Daktulosphaira vitifoliae]|uniref:osteopetrosis-associated transmembrane protein 1 n=1 Tax=Daktulosphaira vitifoliae TaxID=58002 RepID=UPI0021A9971A|nr:osteopetrosis-associated transmembrane protein 1 [Daktulosphaira vitifoliae]
MTKKTRNLIYLLTFIASISKSSSVIEEEVLPEGCEELLQRFANDTARFTSCIINYSRPIEVCQRCMNEYYQVLDGYEKIEKLHKNDSEIDCRAVLINIDRLRVVYASYKYVVHMWDKASCSLCLNGTELNDRTKEVIKLGKQFQACTVNHMNDTNLNGSICTFCKSDYQELNDFYNKHRKEKEFCMDVVDLINTTQSDWSVLWKCHVSNYNSESILLVISSCVLLAPIIFYFISWLLTKERTNELLSQNRWQERFNAASTSGYVVIS